MRETEEGKRAQGGEIEAGGIQGFPRRLIWLLVGLTVGWGFNWPVMKIILSEMPPMHFRLVCLVFGAVGLFVIARAGGLSVRMPPGQWPRVVAIGLVYMGGWNIGAVYGVKLMASGRAAILGYTMPAWGAVLSPLFLGEKLTWRCILGVILAMGGVLLLLGNEFQAVGRSPLGAACMLGAALCWAVSTMMVKRWRIQLPTASFAAWQMVFGVIPILAVALTIEQGTFNPFALTLWPMLGVFYNIFIAYIFCYWAWTKMALLAPLAVSSLAVMMTPIVGVFSSMLLLGERPVWQDYAALVLVVASLCTVLVPPRRACLLGDALSRDSAGARTS